MLQWTIETQNPKIAGRPSKESHESRKKKTLTLWKLYHYSNFLLFVDYLGQIIKSTTVSAAQAQAAQGK